MWDDNWKKNKNKTGTMTLEDNNNLYQIEKARIMIERL